jgi:ferritin-like metal-binding protein YciE
MVTFAAAWAEMAMYESLGAAASEAGDEEVVALGRKLQAEEQDDYEQTWALLKDSAASAFRDEIAKNQHPDQIIVKYLEDAIAAEKSFETQLEGFFKEGNDAAVQDLFAQHARETKTQTEQLTIRLQALGGSTSTLKGFLAHIFNFAPKVAQLGHDSSERLTDVRFQRELDVEHLKEAISKIESRIRLEEPRIHQIFLQPDPLDGRSKYT